MLPMPWCSRLLDSDEYLCPLSCDVRNSGRVRQLWRPWLHCCSTPYLHAARTERSPAGRTLWRPSAVSVLDPRLRRRGRFARGSAGGKLYCGDWQAEYTELHASMLRGERPPRYAVAHGVSGLADNL